jgi:hypothetical protein
VLTPTSSAESEHLVSEIYVVGYGKGGRFWVDVPDVDKDPSVFFWRFHGFHG